MLDYAIHNVMYYKNLYSNFSGSNLIEFYEQLPQLQKTEILHNIEDHTSNEYKKFPQNRYIDVHYTSGSTGHYLKVLKTLPALGTCFLAFCFGGLIWVTIIMAT